MTPGIEQAHAVPVIQECLRRQESRGRGITMQEQGLIGERDFKVVVNHEEQYSLRLVKLAEAGNPSGWRDAGFVGSREDCLAWINEHWTDMRPASLRQRLAETSAGLSAAATPRKSAKASR